MPPSHSQLRSFSTNAHIFLNHKWINVPKLKQFIRRKEQPSFEDEVETLASYLGDEEMEGGATRIFKGKYPRVSIEPKKGRVLIFQQRGLFHSGEDWQEEWSTWSAARSCSEIKRICKSTGTSPLLDDLRWRFVQANVTQVLLNGIPGISTGIARPSPSQGWDSDDKVAEAQPKSIAQVSF